MAFISLSNNENRTNENLIKPLSEVEWADDSYDRKIVSLEELREYSLNYGSEGNLCFDDSAISFLRENNINEVGILSIDKKIFSFSIKISLDKANQFAKLIRNKGGITIPNTYQNSTICVF